MTREERAELAVAERLPEWLSLLKDPRCALQFVGGCGHGKTTHLLAIERQLLQQQRESSEVQCAYIYYPEDGPRPWLPASRPILIDEAQRMGWRQRWRMLRGGGPLVLATHVDLSRQLRWAGFNTTTIFFDRPIDAATLARILHRRIEASLLDPFLPIPPKLLIGESHARQLLERFGTDLRGLEHFLYAEFQLFVAGKSTWPPAL